MSDEVEIRTMHGLVYRYEVPEATFTAPGQAKPIHQWGGHVEPGPRYDVCPPDGTKTSWPTLAEATAYLHRESVHGGMVTQARRPSCTHGYASCIYHHPIGETPGTLRSWLARPWVPSRFEQWCMALSATFCAVYGPISVWGWDAVGAPVECAAGAAWAAWLLRKIGSRP